MRGPPIPNGSDRSFKADERAIEGLPIRLVIALVVGVAALGIMMQILGTFDFGADQEVDINFDSGAVAKDNGDPNTITVVDDSTNEPVPEADIIIRGDTLNLDEPYTATTDSDGKIEFSIEDGGGDVSADWRTTQETGKIKFEVIPPADSPYTDDQGNDKMTVINT